MKRGSFLTGFLTCLLLARVRTGKTIWIVPDWLICHGGMGRVPERCVPVHGIHDLYTINNFDLCWKSKPDRLALLVRRAYEKKNHSVFIDGCNCHAAKKGRLLWNDWLVNGTAKWSKKVCANNRKSTANPAIRCSAIDCGREISVE